MTRAKSRAAPSLLESLTEWILFRWMGARLETLRVSGKDLVDWTVWSLLSVLICKEKSVNGLVSVGSNGGRVGPYLSFASLFLDVREGGLLLTT